MAVNPYAPPRATTDPELAPETAFVVSINCSACDALVRLGQDRCPGCQRSITRAEKRALQERWEASDPEAARAGDATFWGRFAIAGAAAMATVQAFTLTETAVWGGVVAVALWALLPLAFRRARLASAIALVVYVFWWLASLALAPFTVLDGAIVKTLVLLALIGGYAAERALEKRRRAVLAHAHKQP